jgi:flagellar hook-length control protein FliK
VDLSALPAGAQLGKPDSSQLLPDVGWQVDTATLLAHLNRSAQWAPPSSVAPTPDQDALVSSVGAGGTSAKAVSALVSSLPADVSTPGLPTAGAALVTASLDVANSGAAVPLQVRSPMREAFDSPLTQSVAGREAPAPDVPPAATAGAAHRPGVLPIPTENRAALASGDAVPVNGSGVAADDTKGTRWETAQALLQHPASEVAKPAGASVGAAQTASETKARQALGGGEALAQATVAPSAPALASVADDATRKSERVISKATEPHRGAGGEGQWGPYALVSGRTVEATSAAQSSALPTPEMMVAEQVSYWISGKVQNAELRLDVFGREPVDVSISMKGNEAQVEFRTDQPEVRQVLEGALGQLKTLLKDEGLSLAGVFVGSSGQQREGANPSPRQPGDAAARRARVEVSETVTSVKPSGARPLAGRSVDLFV